MLHKKKFGQHFLIDQNIINKLVNYINPTKEDSIIEIGPGDGALTKSIISKVDSMCLIEKDSDLVDELLFITNNYKYLQKNAGKCRTPLYVWKIL